MRQFFAAPEGIRFAMGGIKGLGEGVVDILLEERQKGGHFKSLYDFMKRVDLKKVGKKSIETMVNAGCFSSLGWSKDQLRVSIEPMYEALLSKQKESASGFMNLFEVAGTDHVEERFKEPPEVIERTPEQKELLLEKELLGFFLTGHPLESFKKELEKIGCVPLQKINEMQKESLFRAAFIVEDIKIRFASKSQKKFAILKISDQTEILELPIWPDLFEERGHLIVENRPLFAVLQLEEEGRLSCRWFDALEAVDQAKIEECDRAYDRVKARMMRPKIPKKEEKVEKKVEKPETFALKIDAKSCQMSEILQIKELFRRHSGPSAIEVIFEIGGAELAQIKINEPWGVNVNDDLKNDLKKIPSTIL